MAFRVQVEARHALLLLVAGAAGGDWDVLLRASFAVRMHDPVKRHRGLGAARKAYLLVPLPAKKPLISETARSSIGDKSRPTRNAAISAF